MRLTQRNGRVTVASGSRSLMAPFARRGRGMAAGGTAPSFALFRSGVTSSELGVSNMSRAFAYARAICLYSRRGCTSYLACSLCQSATADLSKRVSNTVYVQLPQEAPAFEGSPTVPRLLVNTINKLDLTADDTCSFFDQFISSDPRPCDGTARLLHLSWCVCLLR